jgi:hypothetical protein
MSARGRFSSFTGYPANIRFLKNHPDRLVVSVPSADRLIPPLGTISIVFQTVTR